MSSLGTQHMENQTCLHFGASKTLLDNLSGAQIYKTLFLYK